MEWHTCRVISLCSVFAGQVDDPDLVDMVLRRELAPQLVSTPVYIPLTQAVVKAHENQSSAAAPHLQLDTVVGQLQEAGLQVGLSCQAVSTTSFMGGCRFVE